jgi:hypothetical protein
MGMVSLWTKLGYTEGHDAWQAYTPSTVESVL